MTQRLLYILPIHNDHEGINLKVSGQLKAFQEQATTTLLSLSFSRHTWLPLKLLRTLFFNLLAVIYMPFFNQIYCRYNPKAWVLNLCIPLLSRIRPITIEHNTIMDTELRFLNRHVEHRLHMLTLCWFRLGNMTHIAVNNELKRHLIKQGLPSSHVIYIQNGYAVPKIQHHDIDQGVIQQVENFRLNYKQCALFCGNGYPWHGLDEVLSLIQREPSLGLIVVGPYQENASDNTLFIPPINTATLISIFKHCDFGISTFRWDLLYITEGSPLKSRQFLCHGLPILTHYYDCASDIELLKPYIFNYQTNKKALKEIMRFSYSKETLSSLAQDALSWNRYVQQLLS